MLCLPANGLFEHQLTANRHALVDINQKSFHEIIKNLKNQLFLTPPALYFGYTSV